MICASIPIPTNTGMPATNSGAKESSAGCKFFLVLQKKY
jgi:hypothetical protein